jgi:hypothetical protein
VLALPMKLMPCKPTCFEHYYDLWTVHVDFDKGLSRLYHQVELADNPRVDPQDANRAKFRRTCVCGCHLAKEDDAPLI